MTGQRIIPVPPKATHVLPNIPCVKQCGENTCWAACAEMVLRAYTRGTPQCAVINYMYSIRHCCGKACNSAFFHDNCDKVLRSSRINIPALYRNYGVTEIGYNGFIMKSELISHLSVGPVLVGIGWTGHFFNPRLVPAPSAAPSGHMIVVFGWAQDGTGQDLFFIHDPKGTCKSPVRYEWLKEPNGLGKWEATWYIKVPTKTR